MELRQFIERSEFIEIQAELSRAHSEKVKSSFNTFSVSSYNSHYENFHSDLIKAILNPFGSHGEGNKFLTEFIMFLNRCYGKKMNPSDYTNAVVEREQGRIDVAIINYKTSKAIIIENKINNAVDGDSQLLRYYNYCTQNSIIVEQIVYLSLDGFKIAPRFDPTNSFVINMAAFNNSDIDLANGWLKRCESTAKYNNSKSFVNEYYKLLQLLNGKAMENNAFEEFYKIVNEENGLNTIQLIIDLHNKITRFRIDKFVSKIGDDYKPFSHPYRYRADSYHLYENFIDGQSNFKYDVWFERDGTANVVFWDTLKDNAGLIGRAFVKEKLRSIGMLDEFEDKISYGNNGYLKSFSLVEYGSMDVIDEAVYKFTRRVFDALSSIA